jgi:VanZ family protein
LKVKPLFFIPAILWVILIYILLTIHSSDIPDSSFLDEIQFDKWVHCGLFAVLVFLFSFPLKKKFPHYTSIYLLIAVLALGYGIGMEYVQKYFTNGDRDFDVWDMVADGVGCIFGLLFIQWQLKRKNAKKLR